MAQKITVRAGDTEPLKITVGATGLTGEGDFTSGALYLRQHGQSTNHVDGTAVTVVSGSYDSAASPPTIDVLFDPVDGVSSGVNALTAAGTYGGYVKVTWSDGDISRHPQDDEDDLVVVVTPNFE